MNRSDIIPSCPEKNPLSIFPSGSDTEGSKQREECRSEAEAAKVQWPLACYVLPDLMRSATRRRLSCCLAHERAIISDHETSPTQSWDINSETSHGTKPAFWWERRARLFGCNDFAPREMGGKNGVENTKKIRLLSLHVGGRWNRKEIMLREFYPLCALDDLVIRLVLCLLLLT